jgi:hypothetical protein
MPKVPSDSISIAAIAVTFIWLVVGLPLAYAGTEQQSALLDWFVKFVTDIKITDVLVAGFTGLLAVYTARLWTATRILADADRPHMLMESLKISGIRQAPGQDGNVRTLLDYRFVNYGRSPAFMRKSLFSVRIGPSDLPTLPEYGEPTSTSFIIGINGWYGSAEPSSILVPLADAAAIVDQTSNYFIYGYIEYSDVAGILHKHRFAYKLEWGAGDVSERFRPAGPDTYREYT